MFVKIEGKDIDSTYECQSAHMRQFEDNEDEVMLTMTSFGVPDTEIHMNKKENSVYYMNNQGKTIDSYCWYIKQQG